MDGGLAVQFQNDFNGQCLTVGGNLLDNAPVVQMPCDANNVLQWWFLVNEPAYSAWHMRSFMGFYLAIPTGAGQGAPLLQTRFSNSPSQLWQTW